MIAADILARELGCTLSDLEELDRSLGTLNPEHMIYDIHADRLRARWSNKNGVDYTDNELIRATTLEHRVNTIRPSAAEDVTVLQCNCGYKITSNAIVPEAAKRRLYKTHALHVATCLMTVEADQ